MGGVVKRRIHGGPRQSNPAGEAELDSDTLQMMEDILSDFSVDELREFLEADLIDVPVDPEFKEQLRKRLWELVESRATDPTGPAEARGPNREPN
jgi:hypothetical protein